MRRRRFLQSATGALAALAGCGGGSGDGTTTHTTVDADIRTADTGPYGDWLVALDGADVFVATYYPAYAQVLEWLPRGGTMDRIEAARSGPTEFTTDTNVDSYFEGFTRNEETRLDYADLHGTLDVESIAARMAERTEFEPADAGPEGFDTYTTDRAAAALSERRFVWAEASSGDPVGHLEAVLATLRGEREPYTAGGDIGLLIDQLRTGHQINIAPSNAEEFGASEYGRQFVFGPERARPEEAVVFDELPDDIRERFESSSIVLDNYDDARVRRVETDGRAAKAVYTTVPNSIV